MKHRTEVTQSLYGKLPDGREVKIYTLTNGNIRARVIAYGATLVSLEAPDRGGKMDDITHGYNTLDGWLANNSYSGGTVGRFGNRTGGGKFTLDGKEFTLAKNNESNALHGGAKGFDKILWVGKITGENSVEFTYFSKGGEDGYPGNLTAKVTYSLNAENELT